ncbi:sulfurtransferase [Oceanicoccus sp. KOV_DT_Chl]|uniref:sulfurtransferase n=1 Tax=Oceanicoccus sp. KOV_DT_Chl TaxID=1904639 RepID=UPI000C7C312A|nr:rhodanese-like domain-containing protein [Oceanicoccus sp. KOV_DT_Chl]
MSQPAIPLLLEAEQLAAMISSGEHKLLILDTCSAANYHQHHVPGAIHIEPKALQAGTAPVPGKLPSKEQLADLFSRIGLTADQHVIAYDDEGGGWAGRLIWTLDVLGHKNTSYLNGGLHAWVNEGHPIETTVNAGKQVNYVVNIDPAPIADIDDIIPHLADTNFAVWDARSAAEYDGTKIVAKRGGRIPGAVNIDWLELMDRDRNMRMIDLDGLQKRLNSLGLSKDKTIVTHCQTHHRSGLSYLAMKILGYPNIKGYHGSWSEWGNREDTPIEAESRQ